jgi:hypothetical protein
LKLSRDMGTRAMTGTSPAAIRQSIEVVGTRARECTASTVRKVSAIANGDRASGSVIKRCGCVG